MARYYGTIQGARGMASRLGHASSGLRVTAQSYSGDVNVTWNAYGDEDKVSITVEHHDRGGSRTIFYGPVQDLLGSSFDRTIIDFHLQCLSIPEKSQLFEQLGEELMQVHHTSEAAE